MKERIFSTVTLWLTVLAALYFLGSLGGVLLLAALAYLAQREVYDLLTGMGLRPYKRIGLLLGLVLTLGTYALPRIVGLSGHEAGTELLVLALGGLLFGLLGGRGQGSDRLKALVATVFGLVYVPFLLHFLIRLVQHYESMRMDWGLWLAVWVIVVAKFTDVGGLLFGKAFGKHKLAPRISPNKTWEGAIGGLILSAVLGTLLAWALRDSLPPDFTPGLAFVLSLPIGAVAVASDLVESVIKREAGQKDSGAVIPGIGGALDLADSILLAAPAAYLIFKYTLAY